MRVSFLLIALLIVCVSRQTVYSQQADQAQADTDTETEAEADMEAEVLVLDKVKVPELDALVVSWDVELVSTVPVAGSHQRQRYVIDYRMGEVEQAKGKKIVAYMEANEDEAVAWINSFERGQAKIVPINQWVNHVVPNELGGMVMLHVYQNTQSAKLKSAIYQFAKRELVSDTGKNDLGAIAIEIIALNGNPLDVLLVDYYTIPSQTGESFQRYAEGVKRHLKGEPEPKPEDEGVGFMGVEE